MICISRDPVALLWGLSGTSKPLACLIPVSRRSVVVILLYVMLAMAVQGLRTAHGDDACLELIEPTHE